MAEKKKAAPPVGRRRNAEELTTDSLVEEGIWLPFARTFAEGVTVHVGGAPAEARIQQVIAEPPDPEMDAVGAGRLLPAPEEALERIKVDPEMAPSEWRVEGLDQPVDPPGPPEEPGKR